jgi:hypothetical protein
MVSSSILSSVVPLELDEESRGRLAVARLALVVLLAVGREVDEDICARLTTVGRDCLAVTSARLAAPSSSVSVERD